MAAREGRLPIIKLDERGLESTLRELEDLHRDRTGERLSSAEFYDRYRRGEIESYLATVWATYYEALLRRRRGPVSMADALPPVPLSA